MSMPHRISFKHAISGLGYVFKNHPNVKVHGLVGLMAIIAGWVLEISTGEWLIISFTIVLVMMAELVNTAIESMTDLITTEYRQKAKVAKDVSAGMVLVTAVGAVIVGLVIFLPKIVS